MESEDESSSTMDSMDELAKKIRDNLKLEDLQKENIKFEIKNSLESRGWDVDGLNTELERTREFSHESTGLYLMPKGFNVSKVERSDEYRAVLGDVAIEAWLRSERKLSLLDQSMDVGVGMRSKVDFVTRNQFGELLEIYEAKTYLRMPRDEIMISHLEKFREQYSIDERKERMAEINQDERMKSDITRIREGKVVFTLVVIIIDENFIESIASRRSNNVPWWFSRLVSVMRGKIMAHNRDSKDYLPESKMWNDNLPSFDELVEKCFWYGEAEEILKEYEGGYEKKMSMDDLVSNVLSYVPVMEEFANKNYVSTQEMGEMIKVATGTQATIRGNFWSRDQNQLKLKHKTKGVRANYIMQLPVHRSVVDRIDDKQWSSIVSRLPERSVSTKLVSSMARTMVINPLVTQKIRDLRMMRAIIKSNKVVTPEMYEKLEELTGVKADRVGKAVKAIDNKFLKIREEVKSSLPDGVTVTKRGTYSVYLNPEERRSIGIGVNKKAPSEKESMSDSAKHKIVDCEEASNFAWSRIIEAMPEGTGYNMDFTGAYPPDCDVGRESDAMAKIAEQLGRVTNTKQYGGLMGLLKCYRAIILSMPRSSTKQARMNEFFMSEHPDMEMRFICSTPPNDISTGAITAVAILKEKLPEWYMEGDYYDMEDGNMLYISKTFRLNRKTMEGYERTFTAYLAFEAFMNECGTSLLNDGLFYSLFLNYSRQISCFEDLIYFYYKNCIGSGNFGRNKIPEKFDPLYFSDVRVAAMSWRLKKNWDQCDNIRTSLEAGNRRFKDMIFDCEHTGLQSFLAINYMRQSILADDGVDKNKFKWNTFANELKFETMYRTSKFHPNFYKPNKMTPKQDMEYFFNNLMNSPDKWQDIAYCRTAIMTMISDIVETAAKDDDSVLNKSMKDDLAMDLIRPSRVMESEAEWKNGELVHDNKKGRLPRTQLKPDYVGLKSVNLGDAVTERIRTFRQEILNNPHIKGNPFYRKDYKYQVSNSDISSGTLALLSSLFCSKSILKIEHKDQFTWDKRGFFVQVTDARNILSFCDRIVRKLLAKVEGDFILVPGNEKYKVVEDAVKRMGGVKMIISQDETKYGDTYVLEALIIMCVTLYKCDYITRPTCCFMLRALSILKRRKILLPKDSYKLWEMSRNGDPEIRTRFGKGGEKFEETVRVYSGLLEEQMMGPEMNSADMYGRAHANPGFYKSVGFTLGVLNMIGSLMTAAHSKLVTIVMRKFGMGDDFKFFTHSDDSIMLTKLPNPSAHLFKETIFTRKVCEWLRHPTTEIQPEGRGQFTLRRSDKDETIILSDQHLSKLVTIISLLTPRFVGQHPSLGKWMMSEMGEVLQSTIVNGKMSAPLIRYMCALGSDTDGTSPGMDLMSSVGRIFDIGNNGGGSTLCARALWLLNHHIYSLKYSIDSSSVSVFKMINFGGLFWALPSELISSGFNGNLIRLLSWTNLSEEMKRQIAISVFEDETWEQKKPSADMDAIQAALSNKSDEEQRKELRNRLGSIDTEASRAIMKRLEMGDNLTMNAMIAELDEGQDQALGNYTGAVLVFKDIMIGYAPDVKSLGNFMGNYSRWESEIDSKVNSLRYIGPDERLILMNKNIMPGVRVKMIADTLAIESMAGSKDVRTRVVSRLAQSISGASMRTAFKVHISWKIISQLGYFKRNIRNPFSEQMSKMIGLQKDEIVQVYKIWEFVRQLARIENVDYMIKGSYKLVDTLVAMNSIDLSSIHNTEIIVLKQYPQTLEKQGFYVKISNAKGFNGFEFSYIKQILSLLIEIGISGGKKSMYDTVAFRVSPLKVMISQQKDHIELVRAYILNLGIPDTKYGWNQVLSQRELFVRMLSNKDIRLIHKIYGDHLNVRYSMLGTGYSLREGRKIKYSEINPKSIVQRIETEINSDVKYRAWGIMIAFDIIFSQYKVMKIALRRDPVALAMSSEELWLSMIDHGFSKVKASLWVSLIAKERLGGSGTSDFEMSDEGDEIRFVMGFRGRSSAFNVSRESGKILRMETEYLSNKEVELSIRMFQNFILLTSTSTDITYDFTNRQVSEGDYMGVEGGMVSKPGTGNLPIYKVKRVHYNGEMMTEYNLGYVKVKSINSDEERILLPWGTPNANTGLVIGIMLGHNGVINRFDEDIEIVKEAPDGSGLYVDHESLSKFPDLTKLISDVKETTMMYNFMDLNTPSVNEVDYVCMDEGRGRDYLKPEMTKVAIEGDFEMTNVTVLTEKFFEEYSDAINACAESITGTSMWSQARLINNHYSALMLEFVTTQPITDLIFYMEEKLKKKGFSFQRSPVQLPRKTLITKALKDILRDFMDSDNTGTDEERGLNLGYNCVTLNEEMERFSKFLVGRDNVIMNRALDMNREFPIHMLSQIKVATGKMSMATVDGNLNLVGFDSRVLSLVSRELSNSARSTRTRISIVGFTSVFLNLSVYLSYNNKLPLLSFQQKRDILE